MLETVIPPHGSIGGYEEGLQRLIGHLRSHQIDIPPAAIAPGRPEENQAPQSVFSALENALLDFFEYRDFEQAHALLHHRQATANWCVLRPVAEREEQLDLSDPTLCPSSVLALELLVRTCDLKAVRIERCWRRGSILVVESAGKTLATVEPITVEPFDRSARDRVRKAFKGVREHDDNSIRRAAKQLPGLTDLAWREKKWPSLAQPGCMLFGYPTNWAIAMRRALQEVGVITTQSQALEAAAVYLGASSWHELIQHDGDPFASLVPVGVSARDSSGQVTRWFYSTPEEALWATARLAGRSPVPFGVDYIEASFETRHRVCAVLRSETGRQSLDEDAPGIECAMHELWFSSYEEAEPTHRAAKLLLNQASARESGGSVATLLYSGTTLPDLIVGIMDRSGIPSTHLVIGDTHFCVVEHRERRGGDERIGAAQEAILHLYAVENEGVHPSHVISMYKAKVLIAESDGKPALEIRGDYGRIDPVTITFPTAQRRQQLLELTHAAGMFSVVGRPRAV